ncbi:cell wall-active antibiotics response protein LiaF [Marinococcus halotolerans]|uniref:cell wall-active antibiotics response protein LiaF n=1 Tax=Marinococcus halotolerans TaxID=301092 RepID=UPI0003B51C1C|nr:cell wall-active antibiotics response protein LiaF [Marinococcus halotolerans]
MSQRTGFIGLGIIIAGVSIVSSQLGFDASLFIWPIIALCLACFFVYQRNYWLSAMFVGLALLHVSNRADVPFIFSAVITVLFLAGIVLFYFWWSSSKREIDIDKDLNTTEEKNRNKRSTSYSHEVRRAGQEREIPSHHRFLAGQCVYIKKPFRIHEAAVQYGAGEVIIDFSKAKTEEETVPVRISGMVGSIKLFVPENWDVNVDAKTIVGETKVLGYKEEGLKAAMKVEHRAKEHTEVTLNIQAELVIGSIQVKYAKHPAVSV